MISHGKRTSTIASYLKIMNADYIIVNITDENGNLQTYKKDDRFHIPDDILNKPILRISAYYSIILGKNYLICDAIA